MATQTINYRIERIEESIPVDEFIINYVEIPKFLKFCKECPNYNNVWSCPEYDFDPMDIWEEYAFLDLTLIKIIYDTASNKQSHSNNDSQNEKLIKDSQIIMKKEKYKLMREYMSREKETPGSFFLSAGSCDLCGYEKGINNCARLNKNPCRHPEQLRYSIESLGGDVIKTAKEIFDIELKWSTDGQLPEYNILVCGLLKGRNE